MTCNFALVSLLTSTVTKLFVGFGYILMLLTTSKFEVLSVVHVIPVTISEPANQFDSVPAEAKPFNVPLLPFPEASVKVVILVLSSAALP